MGIESMTFCTLIGRSTTGPQELIWQARSQYWVQHKLHHTFRGITLVCHRHAKENNSTILIKASTGFEKSWKVLKIE